MTAQKDLLRKKKMSFTPQSRHRKSIRLKGYDYTQPGAYFVTLVTQERACIFGEVVNGEMYMSLLGQVVNREWIRLSNRFPNVELDGFMVMPNHLHGIIVLVDVGRGTGEYGGSEVPTVHPRAPTEGFGAPVPGSIPTIIRSYKSSVTQRAQWMGRGMGNLDCKGTGMIDRCLDSSQNPRTPTCAPTRVWQRNYYEHVIRNETEWERIRAYIRDNPKQWEDDLDNLFHR
jgi:putative transposase